MSIFFMLFASATIQETEGPQDSTIEHFDTVIVGAGIGGLTAAYELKKRFPDNKFHVFEANDDRIGGRIFTTKEQLEMGAEEIRSDESHIIQLCKELNVPIEASKVNFRFVEKGKDVPKESITKESRASMFYRANSGREISWDFVDPNQRQEAIQEISSEALEHIETITSDPVTSRIKGGSYTVIDALQTKIGSHNISTSCPLIKIEPDISEKVTLHFGGTKKRTVTCNQVFFAIPPGPMLDVENIEYFFVKNVLTDLKKSYAKVEKHVFKTRGDFKEVEYVLDTSNGILSWRPKPSYCAYFLSGENYIKRDEFKMYPKEMEAIYRINLSEGDYLPYDWASDPYAQGAWATDPWLMNAHHYDFRIHAENSPVSSRIALPISDYYGKGKVGHMDSSVYAAKYSVMNFFGSPGSSI